mgnify:CR=1 FL=1
MLLAQEIKNQYANKKAQTQRKLKKLGFKPCEISEICGTLGILEEINFSL